MRPKIPLRDPIGNHRRKAIAARRIGLGAVCACGEERPHALIPNVKPPICAACQRIALGKATEDDHHVAGNANNPTTIPIRVNNHRAELSTAQADWPQSTRNNIEASPLLAAAACVRGFVDTVLYLIQEILLWVADLLEMLDRFQVKKLGPRWWIGTEIEPFAPRKKRNAKR
jgi:hypothetical protein